MSSAQPNPPGHENQGGMMDAAPELEELRSQVTILTARVEKQTKRADVLEQATIEALHCLTLIGFNRKRGAKEKWGSKASEATKVLQRAWYQLQEPDPDSAQTRT